MVKYMTEKIWDIFEGFSMTLKVEQMGQANDQFYDDIVNLSDHQWNNLLL